MLKSFMENIKVLLPNPTKEGKILFQLNKTNKDSSLIHFLLGMLCLPEKNADLTL